MHNELLARFITTFANDRFVSFPTLIILLILVISVADVTLLILFISVIDGALFIPIIHLVIHNFVIDLPQRLNNVRDAYVDYMGIAPNSLLLSVKFDVLLCQNHFKLCHSCVIIAAIVHSDMSNL